MNNHSKNRIENEKRWLEHVRRSREHPEGLGAYCREQDISYMALAYWRKKCRAAILPPATQTGQRDFMPVEVLGAEEIPGPRRLPDARWVAQVMLHLSFALPGGGR